MKVRRNIEDREVAETAYTISKGVVPENSRLCWWLLGYMNYDNHRQGECLRGRERERGGEGEGEREREGEIERGREKGRKREGGREGEREGGV